MSHHGFVYAFKRQICERLTNKGNMSVVTCVSARVVQASPHCLFLSETEKQNLFSVTMKGGIRRYHVSHGTRAITAQQFNLHLHLHILHSSLFLLNIVMKLSFLFCATSKSCD